MDILHSATAEKKWKVTGFGRQATGLPILDTEDTTSGMTETNRFSKVVTVFCFQLCSL